jgi:hypothetical protein
MLPYTTTSPGANATGTLASSGRETSRWGNPAQLASRARTSIKQLERETLRTEIIFAIVGMQALWHFFDHAICQA